MLDKDTPSPPQEKSNHRGYYRHSYGYYHKEFEAIQAKKELEKSNPNEVFHVIREKRANNSWSHYRVCVLIPEQGQNKGKKSQIKGKRGKAQSQSVLDMSPKG